MRKIISWSFILILLTLCCSIDFDDNKKENPLAPYGIGLNKMKPQTRQYESKHHLSRKLEIYGGQSADDGQEVIEEGYVNIDFGYTELRIDALGIAPRWGGAYRFPNVTIPPEATINSAYISLEIYTQTFNHAVDSIACQDVDSATIISTDDYSISTRWNSRTSAVILWNEYVSTTGKDSTPDLKTLVQEIVDRPNWKSGNAMIFIFKNTKVGNDSSYYETYSWNAVDHTYGAILYVDYVVDNWSGDKRGILVDR